MPDSPSGFTSPNNPPVGDQMGEMTIAGEDTDCRNCIHFRVCSYYAGVQPMLEQVEDPVFEPHDLAVICDAFEMEEQ